MILMGKVVLGKAASIRFSNMVEGTMAPAPFRRADNSPLK